MGSIAIYAEGLNKIYNPGKKNQVHAVKDLNLKIEKGEIYGLLGENGAGKTTTVRILTTMMKATSGKASILDHDVVDSFLVVEARQMVTFGFQEFSGIRQHPDVAQEELKVANLERPLAARIGVAHLVQPQRFLADERVKAQRDPPWLD